MTMKFEAGSQHLWLLSGSLCLLLLLVPIRLSFAQYRFELTPGISVSEVYDDNIYLDSVDEKPDFITTISPSLDFSLLSQHTTLTLRYAPGFVWYANESENNTVRHFGALTFGQKITEHLRFDLTDTYVMAEDPLESEAVEIEETEGVESARRTRNSYQRNTGSAGLRYLFGPENALTIGYRNSWLENEDPALDDGVIHNPFAGVTYWVNVKNGFEFEYEFTAANFARDDDFPAGDNYTGHGAGIEYTYRFTPHTSGSIGYDFTNRAFDGITEDYQVHEGSIGVEHDFSPDFSVALAGGYFIQKNERSDDETGATYSASLTKRFERGSITLLGAGGWDEAYLEAERTGFTRYWRIATTFEYQILESLRGYGGGSYRQDVRPIDDDQRDRWEVNCGIRWEFLEWFSLVLEYTHIQNAGYMDTDDFRVNRVMLTFTASRLFEW